MEQRQQQPQQQQWQGPERRQSLGPYRGEDRRKPPSPQPPAPGQRPFDHTDIH